MSISTNRFVMKNWPRIDRTGMISLVRLICHCKWCQHKRRVKKEIFQSCHYWTLSIQSYVLNMCAALEHTYINNGCIFKRFCNFWMIVERYVNVVKTFYWTINLDYLKYCHKNALHSWRVLVIYSSFFLLTLLVTSMFCPL